MARNKLDPKAIKSSFCMPSDKSNFARCLGYYSLSFLPVLVVSIFAIFHSSIYLVDP